ncbi:MAG: DNA-processing protein DprA [Saprospiraceae bacterium]|nr:MAG: DNA protecting protein DprA [Bacteroidetes bacterium OLB9]MCO6464327.1 DNA-processing protein DprA [Saprospiraceae bacterium]MCZ2338306.1 DNA-processing protein DprA [Chitinophagales bacterium]
MTDKRALFIALTMTPMVGPVTAKTLISYCGGIEAVFEESKNNLLKIPGAGPILVNNFDPHAMIPWAEKELEQIDKNNIQVLTYLDKNYPRRLNNYDNAPLVLYYKGNCDLNHYRTVGVVGTRKPSQYGITMCERIVEGLSGYNVLLVSGLAFGIDATAHRKSIECGIPTLGVMGNGMDRIYPAEHRSLANKMMNAGGLITEFARGTLPDRENFPMRNRIIAAISDAVIVVESKRKGGSIITAELANDYNKDVFAVPGMVTDEISEGCNSLIKQNKAHLIESAADIAYIMRWEEIDSSRSVQGQLFVDLSEDETLLIDLIRDNREISIDALTGKTGFTPSKSASILLELEFKGLIRTLPGKKYILT